MRFSARMTSKGQITVPKPVREALELKPGDQVTFTLGEDGIQFDRLPSILELAGTVETPEELRDLSWKEIEQRAIRAWAEEAARS